MPKKPYATTHPNAAVIRTHNKKVQIAVSPNVPEAFVIELTKKYAGPGASCQFKEMRRGVGKASIAITRETLEDLIYAYHMLLERLRQDQIKSERVAKTK